jgi:hypothetical protein
MALTTAGATFLMQALIDDSPTFYTNANAYLGVGDSSTAFAIGQTDLQAASNKLRKGMEATYPTRSSNAVTFRSLFGTSEANFAWNEWAVFNASSSGTMFSRKVESLGTKTSAAAWQFTVTLTGTAS